MQLRFQCTFEDFTEALADDAAYRKQKTMRKSFRIIYAIVILCGLPAYIWFEWDNALSDTSRFWSGATAGWIVASLVLLAFMTILARMRMRKQARRLWDGQRSLHEARNAEFSPNGVTLIAETSRSEFQWQAFTRYSETPTLFLIYLSDFQFIMIPKRAMDGPQLGEFRELCQGMLGRAKRGFPVVESRV